MPAIAEATPVQAATATPTQPATPAVSTPVSNDDKFAAYLREQEAKTNPTTGTPAAATKPTEAVTAAQPTPAAKPGEAPAQPPEPTPETVEKETKAALDQAREKLFGKKEVETLESVKKAYAESSKEAKRLVQAQRDFEKSLEDQGLKPVMRKDGKGYDFVATEKYVEKAMVKDLAKTVLSKITEADKESALTEGDEGMAKLVARVTQLASEHTARPRPTIDANEVQIPEIERVSIREKFLKEQENSEDMLPFLDELETHMSEDGFKTWMLKSADNYRAGLDLMYSKVFRYVAPAIARKMDALAKIEEKRKKALESTSVASEGTQAGKAASAMSGTSDSETAKRIANAPLHSF